MEIKVISGTIDQIQADGVIVSCYEGEKELEPATRAIDRELDGAITQLIEQGEVKGKINETNLIHTLGKLPAARVVVLGLGKKLDLDLDKVRTAASAACRLLRQKRAGKIVTVPLGAGINNINPQDSAQAITEGAILGLYAFRKHMTKEPEYGKIKQLNIIEADQSRAAALEQGIRKGRILAEAANHTRDMVNEPSNYMTPTDLAREAVKIAQSPGLEITVLESGDMKQMGMGALLAVSQGSVEPPKFIILHYKGGTGNQTDIALVGKGITFDSGGISIKPSEGMGDMKGDMAGGASVMAALGAIAQLKPRINVIGVIPATENMPGGKAYKPGDILTAMNGKTIEVITTDAEGRLILADALSYTVKNAPPKYIVDVATLTGACHVALGDVATGVFANNQELADKIIKAGKESGELMWQLPMFNQYKEANKSDVADIQNSGGRWGGAITAAQFLGEFVGETPWVHLDIAGTSDLAKERGYWTRGATGVPVRTLVNLVLSLAQ